MAYMNQEKKKELAPAIKAVLKKYGVKGSIAVKNYSTLVVNIRSGKIDFFSDAVAAREERAKFDDFASRAFERLVSNGRDGFEEQVNPYWFHEHYAGKSREFLKELLAAMNNGNHDNSDAQIDYFDVGWYVDVNIGRWDKPYVYEG